MKAPAYREYEWQFTLALIFMMGSYAFSLIYLIVLYCMTH